MSSFWDVDEQWMMHANLGYLIDSLINTILHVNT